MSWELFYLVCFVVGLLLCVVSLVTGGGHAHGGAHLHVGGHGHGGLSRGVAGHAGGHATGPGSGMSGISSVNGFTVTAFLCWFGGTGYLLRTHSVLVAPLVLGVATVSGLAGAGLIFWFLASVLLPRERALTAEETETVGVVGRVTDPLRPGQTGEILYSQMGARRAVPARAEGGQSIDRGCEVVVLRYERGVAYVRPWQDMDL